jgi:hypothetical protein
MYFGRLQWNFLGRELEFEGGDLEIHEKPTGIIAVATVTNRSPYTRFSQAGGGSLEGYENGVAGQYRVNQINIESALMYKGFSWQSELQQKEIINKLDNNSTTRLQGYYVQAGYFLHQAMAWWPEKMEVAARHAGYRPDSSIKNVSETETTFTLNYFFAGHKHKLTTEINYFEYQNMDALPANEWRFRIQWDISL